MKRYKLKIPDMIKKENAPTAVLVYQWERVTEEEVKNVGIPSNWLEEIEDGPLEAFKVVKLVAPHADSSLDSAFYKQFTYTDALNFVRAGEENQKKRSILVMTDNQWMNEEYGTDYNNQDYNSADMRWAFNGGEENGQLKEWLAPEQVNLRKTVEELIEKLSASDLCFSPVVIDDWKLTLSEVLNNLKAHNLHSDK